VNSRRLAHINYKALPYICKAVTGLPELKGDHEGICDGCAQGKNIKNPFPKRDSKQKKHWNSSIQMCVAECHHPPLMGMYTMYHSLMIILIKDLDIFEVFNKIKEFKALIKNLSERKIKILRSDNGGEYTSKEFVSFCRDVGIKRELTTPYNPQQNGVAERKNRTMLEGEDQDLPMCLWAEAAMAVVYVQNRLSHSALGFKTPEEMFTGKKPEVSHLKYLAVQCLFIYRKRKGTNWSPPERREYLWDTVRYPRPSKSTYLVTAILRSAGT
jgi:hypothetical protein